MRYYQSIIKIPIKNVGLFRRFIKDIRLEHPIQNTEL